MTMIFEGRLLFLSSDPTQIELQLGGLDLSRADVKELRNNISTDEISPIAAMVHFDDRLGDYPYTGLKAGDRLPIGVSAVRRGGFGITVAGARFGKGSSREHSPFAEKYAGIRLVIAESFERIYRQNADNIGLFTSTDFNLIDRIRSRDPIAIEELVASRDHITAAILRCGGLLPYGRDRMKRLLIPARLTPQLEPTRSLFEKIILRHAVSTDDCGTALVAGTGGFVQADWRFVHEYYTGMCAYVLNAELGSALELADSGSIVTFEDHVSYVHRSPLHIASGLVEGARNLIRVHRNFAERHELIRHCELPGGEGSEGISHAVIAERYALPGQVVVGTESHTPHSGALGCVAFGVGSTEMANAMVTGAVRITMPEVLKVVLNGSLAEGVTAKDIILHMLAEPTLKAGAGVGKVFEFSGPVIAALSTDERSTLTNMTAELGGFTGIVAPDAETVRFLRERRGIEFRIESWMKSDADVEYAKVMSIDCSTLGPMVAAPGDPGNAMPVASLTTPVPIDIAYGGSCTAGKRADFDYYHEVLHWALVRGLKVPANVRLYLQFNTTAVRDYCEKNGYLATFRAIGAEILQPGCGACANCGPGSSTAADQITVSAINRNFPGRSGPGKVWLASPPTVAASAISGKLASFEELRRSFSV